jgi:hypothetical protein
MATIRDKKIAEEIGEGTLWAVGRDKSGTKAVRTFDSFTSLKGWTISFFPH